MDGLFDNDLDNNNNVVLNNNNNAALENNIEENRNENMENIIQVNSDNDEMRNNDESVDLVVHEVNDAHLGNNIENHNDTSNIESSLAHMGEGNRSQLENVQVVFSNSTSLSTRKSKKRKRHIYKKWNKSYKRQKSANTTKSDAENVLQISRNKHLYTKVPKVMHRGSGLSKFFLPDKRPRKDIIVPPTKFLLGGNISDPLNLNSLQDEALSMSAVTPKSSPITTPPKVEVIIPPNIYDPLHLLDPVDSVEYEKQLVSPLKTRRLNKQRSRKKKMRKCSTDITLEKIEVVDKSTVEVTQSVLSPGKDIAIENTSYPESEAATCSTTIDVEKDEKCKVTRDLQLDLAGGCLRKRKYSESGGGTNVNCNVSGIGSKKLRRFDSKDKIVSPVIPQPGAWKRPPKVLLGAPRNRIRTTSINDADNLDELNNKKNDALSIKDLKPDEAKIECLPEPVTPTKESNSISTATSTLSPTSKLTSSIFSNVISSVSALTSSTTLSMPMLPLDNSTINPNNGTTNFNPELVKYQFGNYVGQYDNSLQTLMNLSDVRLTVFLRHAYLFKHKDILDIGCNVGHMTIAVARKLHPKSIVGVDIDKNLIAQARRNLSKFQRIPESELRNINSKCKTKMSENDTQLDHLDKEKQPKKTRIHLRYKDRESNQAAFFPLTFPICFGGLPIVKHKIESPSTSPASNSQNNKIPEQHPGQQDLAESILSKESTSVADLPISEIRNQTRNYANENGPLNTFPDNVFFRTLNYAVTDESQMVSDRQQYDLILCLSLTKWIHLNFGDNGLKMTFRRMFNQLRPGGKLILEAQNWASYKKRKKVNPVLSANYKSIEFFPSNFHEYLLSPEVGFSHSFTLGVPRHASKGFYRPIQLYIKGDFTPSQVRWSDTYHPQTPYEPMVPYAHYVDPVRISAAFGTHWNYKMSNIYKTRETPFSYNTNRYNTPSHGISSSTSRYYNPLETDSYLPSYDNIIQTRHYCFASPLYSTVWSPPTSGRKSASQTPLFGSIRRVDTDDQEARSKHVYLTPRPLDGSGSSRSIEENNSVSPQTHHVYAIGSSRSVREPDLDTNTNSPTHVYAFQ